MEHANLKYQAVSGAKWSGVSIAYITLVNFVTTAILARLLSPSDFGLLGMMIVVIGLIGFLADAGVSNAIIYHQDATREELSSLYWLNFLAGIGLFIIILLFRPLAVALFKEPRLSTYLPWLATSFLVMPIGQQFGILLRKDLRFKTLTKIDVASTTISSVTAIAIALSGFGIWSLVFRAVIGSTIGAFALLAVGVRNKWLPRLYFSLSSIKRYLKFGFFQMGQRFLNHVSSNIDYIIIGRFLGVEALGFYSLAYGLITLPLSKINPIITRVAFPIFAKIQCDDERLRNGYLKMLKYISTCSFPLMAGMFVVAPLFIPVVYGAKWLPTVPVLQILCMIGALKSLGNPIGSLLMAKGRADISFYWFILAAFIMFTANIIGIKWGVVGVAWSVFIATLILWPGDFYLRWFLVRMRVIEYFDSFKIPAIASGLMIIFLWSTSFLWNQMNDIISLVFQIIVGATFYFVMIWIIGRPLCLELKDTVFSRG